MQEIQETTVRLLDWEDLLEKSMATHSSILACIIPWTEGPGRLQSMGPQRVRHSWSDWTHTHSQQKVNNYIQLKFWNQSTHTTNQSILAEINPEYSLEGLMLKMKLWPPDAKSWPIRKDPDSGKDWRQGEKGMTEDEMVGWHHQLNGHEFEQALGDGEGQGSLACCSPLVAKSRTWLSNWTTTTT